MSTVSNEMLGNIFAYMNSVSSSMSSNNNNKNNSRYPIGNNLIFGEELNSYVPIPGEEHYSVMEKDPFAAVRFMAINLTREVYGEPRLVDFIVGVYKDLIVARKARGYFGVRGLNMKGILSAILYLIILYTERTRLSLDVLVKAANNLSGQSKTKVNEKMLNRYIKLLVDTLTTQFQESTNNENNNNNKTILKHVDEEIKRLVIKLKYNRKDTQTIRTMVRGYPRTVLTNHIPRTIAALAVFTFVTRERNMSTKNGLANKALLKEIGITRPVLEKLVQKIKNVSIN